MSRPRRGTLVLVLALAGGLALVRALAQPSGSPILATEPLHLDPRGEVDVALDSRHGRFFIINGGVVQTFDTRTGARVYMAQVGTAYLQGMNGPGLTVDARAGQVFVPNLVDDAVGVLNARTGRVVRTIPVDHQPDEVTFDAWSGRLFVGSTADWTLTMLDGRTGARLRTIPFAAGDLPGQLVVDPRLDHGFAADYAGQVALFDTRTGALLRRVTPAGGSLILHLAIDAPAARVLGLVEGRADVVLLDARSGLRLRSILVGEAPNAIAVDARWGHAFVSDDGTGRVYMLGVRCGRVLRAVAVGAAPVTAIDARRQRVIVASAAGVTVLDARSGAVLDRAPLALITPKIAVDTQTGHIFVVSVGGAWRPPDPWRWLPAALRRRLPVAFPPLRTRPARLYVLDERRL